MKKSLAAVMCAALLLSGCSAQKIKDEVKEEAQDIKEDIQEAVPSQTTDGTDTSQFVGEEKAKEIALQKAGITAEGVTFDRIELENDDGVWQYEIEFRKDKTEYNADVNAKDGSVISWEIDSE